MTRRVFVWLPGLVIPAGISAQIRRGGGVDETTRIINDCERRTNDFKKTLDRALGRNAVRLGEGREQQLNRDADNLENRLDKVGDSWNKDHDINKTKGEVRAAIAISQDINRTMRAWPAGDDVAREWSAVKAELNRLAQTFRLPRIGW